MSKEIVDPYAGIKQLLPVEANLGFVFDIGTNKSLVIYTEGLSRKIRHAYYDGRSLVLSNQADNPMLEDGLGEPEKSEPSTSKSGPATLFQEKFRPASPFDRVVLELLEGVPASHQSKVAIGLEVVFTKVNWKDGVLYDRKDWELGVTIVSMLHNYPVLNTFANNKDLQMNVKNAEYVLNEMSELFAQTHRSKCASKVIATTWSTVDRNFSLSQYHPVLAPLYTKVAEASKNYLLETT